jgi:hypothetical protein
MGMGTHVNIAQLIRETKKYKKKDKQIILFIDYKSAYNTVIRDILYELLLRDNILN